ncbi:flagellar assembly protein T N-terminal domain-containing protein [Amantichitinum ursilacus]|nr:flagellar assembly protein T N-terminal domain-containing protein [Amantichitinum ursilacus]
MPRTISIYRNKPLGLIAAAMGLCLLVGAQAATPTPRPSAAAVALPRVTGVAPIGSEGEAAARAAALRDAEENIALMRGARITGNSQSNKKGWFSDNQRVRADSNAPVQYTVLREWKSNGLYHVDVQPLAPAAASNDPGGAPADDERDVNANGLPLPRGNPVKTDSSLPPGAASAVASSLASPQGAPRCPANPYRRKMLVTPFWLRQPAQAVDMKQLSGGIQQLFMQKLAAANWLPSASQVDVPFDLDPRYATPIQLPDQVRLLGRRFGTQFVLGGIVQDVSTEGEVYRFTWGQDTRPGERKLSAEFPLAEFAAAGVKATPKSRHADLEMYLFDAVSGVLIAQHRASVVVTGDILGRNNNTAVATASMGTDFGKALDTLTGQLVAAANEDAACVPFSARVTNVENGVAYIDAGAISGLEPGDKLQLFKLKPGSRVISTPGGNPGMGLGLPEDASGTVTITQVQPQFAAAVVEGGKVEAGDFVRYASGSSGQGRKRGGQ